MTSLRTAVDRKSTVRILTAEENLFVCSAFKNGPSAHLASWSMDNGGTLCSEERMRRPGLQADQSTPPNAEVHPPCKAEVKKALCHTSAPTSRCDVVIDQAGHTIYLYIWKTQTKDMPLAKCILLILAGLHIGSWHLEDSSYSHQQSTSGRSS